MPRNSNTTIEKKKQISDVSYLKGSHRNNDIIRPAKIAIPPKVGIGVECSLREFGTSYNLYFFMMLIIGGIVISVTAKAVQKHNKAYL
jgi:hypothetical protein